MAETENINENENNKPKASIKGTAIKATAVSLVLAGTILGGIFIGKSLNSKNQEVDETPACVETVGNTENQTPTTGNENSNGSIHIVIDGNEINIENDNVDEEENSNSPTQDQNNQNTQNVESSSYTYTYTDENNGTVTVTNVTTNIVNNHVYENNDVVIIDGKRYQHYDGAKSPEEPIVPMPPLNPNLWNGNPNYPFPQQDFGGTPDNSGTPVDGPEQ